MLRVKQRASIFLRKHVAAVKCYAEIGGVRRGLDDGEDDVLRRLDARIFISAHMSAAIPGKAEVQSCPVGAIDFAGRSIVAHGVDLIVGEPERPVGIEGYADGIANAGREDFAVRSVEIHPNDAANSRFLVERELVARRDIVRLAERNIELVVGTYSTHARRMAAALFVPWNEIA